MTKRRYPMGCDAGSQVPEHAGSPDDNAWFVNFNNGNSNVNHRNNGGFLRACRPSECHDSVTLRALHTAWRQARAGKDPSQNQFKFEYRLIDGLLHLQSQINAYTWKPAPSTCFIAPNPKMREIHAPGFSDRIVHHWLVPYLTDIYERRFIHDSYSNRVGKGTHAGVDRLRSFMRQVHSGQGGGYYLQLDIRNFFNTIHRPTLWQLLKPVLTRAGLPNVILRVTHALLNHSQTDRTRDRSTPAQRAAMPPHKRLINAAPGCGIAIGNLSSQFFANVYLHELDLFVKHVLKAKRYVRYVDDFVIIHHDRDQLVAWHAAIADFLATRLKLQLKDTFKLQPLTAGVDFLGYVIYPSHTVVRRRVIKHAFHKLESWERRHVRRRYISGTPKDLQRVGSIYASYLGHLDRANAYCLKYRITARFPWLTTVTARRSFDASLVNRRIRIPRFSIGSTP